MLSPEQIQQYKAGMGVGNTSSPSQPATHDWVDSLTKSPTGKLGGTGSNSLDRSGVATAKNYVSNVAQDYSNAGKAVSTDLQHSSTVSGGSPLDALHTVGDAAGAVFAPVTEAVKPVMDAASNAISNEPSVQASAQTGADAKVLKLQDTFNTLKDNLVAKHPESAHALEDLWNIGQLFLGEKAQPAIDSAVSATGSTLEKGANALSDTASKVADLTTKNPTRVAAETAKKQAVLESSAIKDATPSYDESLIGDSHIKNEDGSSTPRVSEADSKNPFKERVVTSTPSEIEAGKELSKVPGYDPKATALDKYNKVTNYNLEKSKAYRESLANEKIVIPKKEMVNLVKKTVQETSQNSLLLQKTDPIVKNYIRVAQRAADTVEGTLAGEDKLRLALDQAYEDAGGKYGNNKGLDQIHRAARDAITKDMIAKARTTEVKGSLKEMSNLYKASDVLKDKARLEGGSKWEQFKKAHPVIAKTTKAVGRAMSIGTGVHLAP